MTIRIHHRSGVILLIVAGISGLLASLAIAFLARILSDQDEMSAMQRETQARIMLTAACNYIQEASRIGWEPRLKSGDSGGSVEHMEAYGWIDVRDGSMGPRLNSLEWPSSGDARMELGAMQATGHVRPLQGNNQSDPLFPVNVPMRFPMFMVNRPPFAIQMRTGYNPISTKIGDPDRFVPYLRNPDPQPAVDNKWSPDDRGASVDAANWESWVRGDPSPRNESLGLSWFRILREDKGSVFTVTCGAGGSWGFFDWNEVEKAGEGDKFDNNPKVFDAQRNAEVLYWFRIEWSPAIPCIDHLVYYEHHTSAYMQQAITSDLSQGYGGQLMAPNMGGTIQWVQRLRNHPPVW